MIRRFYLNVQIVQFGSIVIFYSLTVNVRNLFLITQRLKTYLALFLLYFA